MYRTIQKESNPFLSLWGLYKISLNISSCLLLFNIDFMYVIHVDRVLKRSLGGHVAPVTQKCLFHELWAEVSLYAVYKCSFYCQSKRKSSALPRFIPYARIGVINSRNIHCMKPIKWSTSDGGWVQVYKQQYLSRNKFYERKL